MNLVHLSPDPNRAERVRSRCHSRLARKREARYRLPLSLEQVVMGAFGAIYLLALARNALSVFAAF